MNPFHLIWTNAEGSGRDILSRRPYTGTLWHTTGLMALSSSPMLDCLLITWLYTQSSTQTVTLKVPIVVHRNDLVQNDHVLHGKAQGSENSAKYLRVTLTNHLHWNDHINNIKANRALLTSSSEKEPEDRLHFRPLLIILSSAIPWNLPALPGILTPKVTSISWRLFNTGLQDLPSTGITTHLASYLVAY